MASKINFNTVRQLVLLNVLQKQKFKALNNLHRSSGELSFPLSNIQRKPYSTENDSSDSDDEKKPKKALDTKKDISSVKSEASKKLTALLSSIKVENTNSTDKKRLQLNLAKPGGSKKLKEQVKQHFKAQTSPLAYETSLELEEKQLNEAVTSVAQSLGGDVKKTESELLKRLISHATETGQGDKESSNMSEIFLGMKIDREKPKKREYNQKFDRVEMDEPLMDRDEGRMKRYRSESYRMINTPLKVPYQKINLFGNKPIGFFQSGGQKEETVSKSIWERLEEKELNLLVTHPPENGFEEMIKWTEEGKLWHFPINNEFGLDEEANVGFEEHVFLEPLLEGFPIKGPIRHFMELVVVGLSKNPYIPVQRKRENIEWFRQYFQEKESFLKEIGSLDEIQQTSSSSSTLL